MTATLRLAHTSQLDESDLRAARRLLDATFDDMRDVDWEHALGGMHALLWEDGELIGHASVIQRRILHAGQALRAGHVEAVAVRGDRRGHGHGTTLMEAIEGVIRGAYILGALGAAEDAGGFYAHRGWQLWRGRTSVLSPDGIRRTEDDDGDVYVLPVDMSLDFDAELTCDWRDGDEW